MDEASRATRLSEQLTARLTGLGRVLGELAAAQDLQAVTDIVVHHMADVVGATVSSLSLVVAEDTLALMGLRGARPGAASKWATFPISAATPASEAARTGRTIVLRGREAILRRYPDLELAAEGERSMVSLPLRVGERVLGVVGLSFPGRLELEPSELEFHQLLADVCAQTVDRIRARETAADRATRLRFLAEASAELASSLDYEATLGNVAWLAVPAYADWCSVSLEQDGVLRTLAVAHQDREKRALVLDYQRRFPPDPDAGSGSYRVLRSGRSELVAEITDAVLAETLTDRPEALELVRELGFRSALSVPLQARGRTFGVMTWVSGEDGRRFTAEDVAFGEDLGRRAATAIDNALLHSEVRDFADRLHEVVSPPALPQVEGWELAAVYSPAGRLDVGGDFYDAIPLGDGRLALVIGDVMGRGVRAVTAMAQVRSAVRTLVAVDPTPTAVLGGLDLLFERFPTDQLVTACYVLADPGRGRLDVGLAGHPAPLVVDASGTGRFLDEAQGLILGVRTSPRDQVSVPFGTGQALVLYTDGLVERRTEDLDAGRARLLEALPCVRGVGLAEALEKLSDGVRDHTRDDDVALLGARRLSE